jgi:hypothetical protein
MAIPSFRPARTAVPVLRRAPARSVAWRALVRLHVASAAMSAARAQDAYDQLATSCVEQAAPEKAARP